MADDGGTDGDDDDAFSLLWDVGVASWVDNDTNFCIISSASFSSILPIFEMTSLISFTLNWTVDNKDISCGVNVGVDEDEGNSCFIDDLDSPSLWSRRSTSYTSSFSLLSFIKVEDDGKDELLIDVSSFSVELATDDLATCECWLKSLLLWRSLVDCDLSSAAAAVVLVRLEWDIDDIFLLADAKLLHQRRRVTAWNCGAPHP